MADRFWVGGTGNWSDNANHWSDTRGGSPGASLPTSSDNVYIPDATQTITINTSAACLSIAWDGSTNATTLAGTTALTVYGSFTLPSTLVYSYTGSLTFASTSTGKTITTNGVTLSSSITFNGVGGEWTLQDNLTVDTTHGITLTNGALLSNSKNITCGGLRSSGSTVRTLNIQNSTVTINGTVSSGVVGSLSFTNSTNMTYDFSGSTIIFNPQPVATTVQFNGGGLTYNNVSLLGNASYTSVSGSNTFVNLTLGIGEKKINAGTTQTITTILADGTEGNYIKLRSATPGSTYTVSVASGSVIRYYYDIQDCIATGGATFTAVDSINSGNNTGWVFEYNKSYTVSTTALANAIINKNIVKSVSLTTIVTAFKSSEIGKIYTVMATANTTNQKAIAKSIAINTKVSAIITKNILRSFSTAITSAISSIRNTSKLALLTNIVSVSKKSSVGKTCAVTAKSTISTRKVVAKSFTVNTKAIVVIPRNILKLCSTTVKSATSSVRNLIHAKAGTVHTSAATSCKKNIGKIISVNTKVLSFAAKAITKSFRVVTAAIAYILPLLPWKQTLQRLTWQEYKVELEVDGVATAGNTITLQGTFEDLAGVLTSVQNVVVKIYNQGKVLLSTITDITNPSIGVYQALYSIPDDANGQYDYEFHATLNNKPIVARSSFDANWKQG